MTRTSNAWLWPVVVIVVGLAASVAVAQTAEVISDAADEIGDVVLTLIGALGGGPVFLAAAAIYRRIRPARAVVDLVKGTQGVREIVGRVGGAELLGQVDAVLRAEASPPTRAAVGTVKGNLARRGLLRSVTDLLGF